MFGKLRILYIYFFTLFLSTYLNSIDNRGDCNLEKINLIELKEQTKSVLKKRLLELGNCIITRKNELACIQYSKFAEANAGGNKELKKELSELEKHYEKLESKIAGLDNLFDESQDISFFDSNKIKSIFLILAITGLTGGLGYIGANHIHNRSSRYVAYGLTGIFLLVELLMFYFSETIALVMSDARTLDKEKYAHVYRIVEKLAQKAGIPKPKVFYNQMSIPNAFACGRNKRNASVLVTQGLLDLLDERELSAVLAHEISHIRHSDIMLTSVANAISTPGLIAAQALKDGIHDRTTHQIRNDLFSVACYFMGLFGEWTFKLMNLSISRSREYMADQSGAKLCADPMALASALNKIKDRMVSKFNDTSNFTSSELKFSKGFEMMCIASPFQGDLSQGDSSQGDPSKCSDDQDAMENKIDSIRSWIEWIGEWFSTHPLTKNRIAKLKELEQKYIELLNVEELDKSSYF